MCALKTDTNVGSWLAALAFSAPPSSSAIAVRKRSRTRRFNSEVAASVNVTTKICSTV
jgi:hypothetical protein